MQIWRDFIETYVPLTDVDWTEVSSRTHRRTLAKGQFYLRPGQINGEFVFIESGALRVFQTTPDEQEHTAWLAVDGQSFCDLASFRDQRPTRFSVQALADTTLLVVAHSDMQYLYGRKPIWQEFGRKLWEDVSVQLINTIVSFQAESAEARYERISREKILLQNAPLKFIAEFLGITPHTLSRVRGKKR
ncbi:Crp/Fnr family transcriptional regulator [Spirosoma montaniterrae]|uniref:Cyclic nucleotide-binding domain-containing protein n=1 Tax=Spirosoma montaniterrae TaxID=1178516 RepID=A0A1P9WS31_9BACT|nr:cyclic nucleotide-binding domain-containing protein [Spirosoma montaniterrae]AQG78177.1 hypothetical protein AWR27_01725 [Spirosoma montaniterrae]